MHILIIQGHPDSESYSAQLARRYKEGAESSNHRVELLSLGELSFDPILRKGYRAVQPLEPDLERAQQLIKQADHLVFVYPNWWGMMPALLKGFFDRVFLPGFAFKYQKGSPFPAKLLLGKTAHLVITMDTPPFYYRWIQGRMGIRVVKSQILNFCGIRPVTTTMLGPVRNAKQETLQTWLQTVFDLGVLGK